MKKITVVTVNYNTEEDTRALLESLEKVKLPEILLDSIIVDNGSDSAFSFDKKEHVTVIRSEINTGFTGGYNIGIKKALERGADYILIINSDTVVDPNMIVRLLEGFDGSEKIGVTVPKIYFAKGHEFHKEKYKKEELGKVFWYAGGYFDWDNIKSIHRGVDEVDHGQYDRIEKIDFATHDRGHTHESQNRHVRHIPVTSQVMGRAKWIAAGVTGALVLGIVGAATAYAVAPDIPRDINVLGITIGGKSKAQAATALRQGLASRAEELAQPVTVSIEGRTATVQPQDVGLAVDVDATVEQAAKRRVNPFKMFGRTQMQPVVNVDGARLVTALQPAAEGLGTPATMPGVTFEGLVPKPVYPVTGHGLDPAAAAQALTSTWLRKETVIPIVDIVPASSKEDVDAMVTQLALPAVAAPVTVSTGKADLVLAPEQIAASLVINSDDKGKLTPHVDEAKLRAAFALQLATVEVPPKNATVGDGQIVASQPGELVDTAALATDLMPVLPKTAERTVTAGVKPTQPATTTGHLTDLGIKEQVSTFTTYFTGGMTSPRSINIITGANKVDSAIVKPGETFSLNNFTGPRGYAEGYKDAPIIMNGKLTPGVGGGMSQFTTTLYNASYYAGMEDVEHHPHSIYFSTYPSVVESTIFYPTLDLQFKNTTPYGILIDTSYTNDSLTVSMWSTKVYDSVTTEWSDKRNWTDPKPVTVPDGPSCIARSGSKGFTQDAWRIIHKNGQEIQREKFTWRYDAEPTVICGDPER